MRVVFMHTLPSIEFLFATETTTEKNNKSNYGIVELSPNRYIHKICPQLRLRKH